MKDNKEILSEAFFKKASYDEKLAKKLPQYAPVDPKQPVRDGLNPFENLSSYQVTDTDEVKRRLAGTYGVAFGNNNVKNMASKALKTFPILVSDNIEPETAIMLKKLMEEQYAEYVNLLISNQVVNLADYKTDEVNGNVAIQALDTISGMDYAKSRVANKAARTDNLEVGDIFANIPLYNLLRENEFKIDTGDVLTNALLEDAVVVPSEETETFVEFFKTFADEIATLNEASPIDRDVSSSRDLYSSHYSDYDKKKYEDNYAKNDIRYGYDAEIPGSQEYWEDREAREGYKDKAIDAISGYAGTDPTTGEDIYRKISTGDIVLDPKRFDQAINRTVGEFLAMPENRNIRERFELATFLLQSRRIAGMEYYNYLTMRLGIPVSDRARKELIVKYRIDSIRSYGDGLNPDKYGEDDNFNFYQLDRESIDAIAHNRRRTEGLVKEITKVKIKDVLRTVGIVTGTVAGGIGVGAAIGSIVKAVKNPGPKPPIVTPEDFFSIMGGAKGGILLHSILMSLIIGSAIGIGFAISKAIKAYKRRKVERLERAQQAEFNKSKIEGWERVEKLVNQMLAQREEVRSGNYVHNVIDSITVTDKDLKNSKISDTIDGLKDLVDIDTKSLAKSNKELADFARKDSDAHRELEVPKLKKDTIYDPNIVYEKDRFGADIVSKPLYKIIERDKDTGKPTKMVKVIYGLNGKPRYINSSYNNISDMRADIERDIQAANNAINAETGNYGKLLRESYLTEADESEVKDTFNYFNKDINKITLSDEDIADINAAITEVNEELAADKEYQAEILAEKVLAKTRIPMKVQYVEKNPEKNLLLTPELGPRTIYAFGSTEIERKENKDRKYNQPLIMTVKFRERFSDGKIGDNELTAVIGILGKIIRIPTEEMEYVLKESVNGNTIEGIFKTGNLGDSIEDMLSMSKVSNDLKNLQKSADIWHNLEKVTTLALANKISGKRNNNISNAHIIFSQKEVDAVRTDTGVDIIRDTKKAVNFMKRYSAFTLMIANDAGQRVYILDDQDNISWDVLPYSAIIGKDQGEQLSAALNKMMRH